MTGLALVRAIACDSHYGEALRLRASGLAQECGPHRGRT
jgi:hypothetical protein